MARYKKRLLFFLPAGALLLLLVGIWLYTRGILLLNRPPEDRYPVRGVDVSSYQGTVDWPVLAGEKIRFAYIKATEGSGHADGRFAENWAGASAAGLRVGAYHFFSYDSPGASQAENFIKTVPPLDGMLPPAVDVEFYGDKARNPPERAAVHAELQPLLDALEAHYGMKPVLYATGKAYRLYLRDAFEGYPIWIRNVYASPSLPDGRGWTFWQYTDRARLKGYDGAEPGIDLNVFSGGEEAFAAFPA